MNDDTSRRVWIYDDKLSWVKGRVLSEGIRSDPSGMRIIVVVKDSSQENILNYEVSDQTSEGDKIKSLNLFEEDSKVRSYLDVQDLTQLVHLNEAEILEALCTRFAGNQIYTYTGPVLIAVNPYKSLPIYDDSNLKNYFTDSLSLPPHVFAIGNDSYRNLIDTFQNQSILVSGESGAGKSESTKYVMKYIATRARSGANEENRSEQILQSNPILESFGNARTNRNDNSSRFGKFIEMSFTQSGQIIGAEISTYLLEKIRLIRQGDGERNFHIFYQMQAGANEQDKARWLLPSLSDSNYTNQSQVYDRRDGVSDEDSFTQLEDGFEKINLSQEERDFVFSMVSGVLNLGNVSLDEIDENGSGAENLLENSSLQAVARLFQVDLLKLLKALTIRKIHMRSGEVIDKPLKPEDAKITRDSLAKTVYSHLFEWVVNRINRSILTPDAQKSKKCKISVLDIFGFEVFEHNSFEQLCINYANEALQQHFNEFMFHLEQSLYHAENIHWDYVDFPDNKNVLALIQTPKTGLFAMLDEQCLFPQGNDKAYANKIYAVIEKDPSEILSASKSDRALFRFCVRHYAGTVVYETKEFCAKNKDDVREEALELMRSSLSSLVLKMFEQKKKEAEISKHSIQSPTVNSQFKIQLSDLIEAIKQTSPHYIRCLKPNDNSESDCIVRPRLVDQLRYGGVLEAVKVARAGYPTRYSLQEFVRRFFMLSYVKQGIELSNELPSICESILVGRLDKSKEFEIGKTKIFLKKEGFEKLEADRLHILKINSKKIQAAARMYMDRKRFIEMKRNVIRIQSTVRLFCAKKSLHCLRQTKAAKVIQRSARKLMFQRMLLRRKLENQTRIVIKLQGFVRLVLAKKRFKRWLRSIAVIQQLVRCFLAKKGLLATNLRKPIEKNPSHDGNHDRPSLLLQEEPENKKQPPSSISSNFLEECDVIKEEDDYKAAQESYKDIFTRGNSSFEKVTIYSEEMDAIQRKLEESQKRESLLSLELETKTEEANRLRIETQEWKRIAANSSQSESEQSLQSLSYKLQMYERQNAELEEKVVEMRVAIIETSTPLRKELDIAKNELNDLVRERDALLREKHELLSEYSDAKTRPFGRIRGFFRRVLGYGINNNNKNRNSQQLTVAARASSTELFKVRREKDSLMEKVLHVSNENKKKDSEIVKQQQLIDELNEKIVELSQAADQNFLLKTRLAVI